jgi:hypothetical protein
LDGGECWFRRRIIRRPQRDRWDVDRKEEELSVGCPDLDGGNVWVVAKNLPV